MKHSLFTSLVFSALFNYSYAGVFDHLKKAEGKSDLHRMRNVDFIYMINLDQRPEKFALASDQLRPYGIIPYRFSAVNGWELTVETINDVGLKYRPGMTPLMSTRFPPEGQGFISHEFMTEFGKTYFCHGMARGPIGIALSHISILKDAWDSGYETIWVMEDDIEVDRNPHMISDLIDILDNLVGCGNWDVLLTDQDTKNAEGKYVPAYGATKRPDMDCSAKARHADRFMDKSQISSDFRKVSARFGAYSMIIRRSGMKKLLDFFLEHQIYLPYDMDNYLPHDIQRYSFTFDIVSTMIDAITDNSLPNYKKKKMTASEKAKLP